MNIVIVGAGRVGRTLSEKLSLDGHDVSLIDADPAKVREVSQTLDVHVICGNGATAPELRRAGNPGEDLQHATFVIGDYGRGQRLFVQHRTQHGEHTRSLFGGQSDQHSRGPAACRC